MVDLNDLDAVPTATLLSLIATLSGVVATRLTEKETKDQDEQYLSAEGVAAMLQVTPDWVYRHGDDLGAIRLSERLVRYPRSSVHRYMKRMGTLSRDRV